MKFQVVLLLAVVGVAYSGKRCKKLSYAASRSPDGRVVNGEKASPHEFQSMLRFSHSRCSAALIHPQWAITAAHCVHRSGYELVAGDHNIDKNEGTEQTIKVAQIIRHPKYRIGFKFSHDFALLKFERPFHLNEYVQVVKLPPSNFKPKGYGLVAGWGRNENNALQEELRKASVKFVSQKKCKRAYKPNGDDAKIDDSMICAGHDNKDACKGDSGGPLFCDSPNGRVHCGVVSWGIGCAVPGKPGVYARTLYFLDWIQQTTGIKV